MLFNPTTVLDALDESASELWKFPGGRVGGIDRHVFRAETIGDAAIFKIPTLKRSPPYYTDKFRGRVERRRS
jgi:hypothetical protein